MLAIRLKRTGRKGHAQYRMIAQDSHRSPSSGKVAAYLGSYDPHAKTVNLDTDKISYYLEHGAQPTNRVVRLLKAEGVKLPKWVKFDDTAKGSLRNPEKLRKNQPEEEAPAEEPAAETEEVKAEEAPTEEVAAEESKEQAPAEEPAPEAAEETAEEAPAEKVAEEKPEAESEEKTDA